MSAVSFAFVDYVLPVGYLVSRFEASGLIAGDLLYSTRGLTAEADLDVHESREELAAL